MKNYAPDASPSPMTTGEHHTASISAADRFKATGSRIEEIISAWAFAHNIDGAARNDLFDRLRRTRPTPDGEIGELVEAVARDQFTFQMGETNLTWESRPEYEREARIEQARHWCELPTIAAALETQAADIARLREALGAARPYIVPGRLGNEIREHIDAALATRTDVR